MVARVAAGDHAGLVARVDDGTLRVDVSETAPLSRTASVDERSAAGQTRGKILLMPTP